MAYGPAAVAAAEQVEKVTKAVTEALQAAGAKLHETGADIGTRAVTQAQQNTSQMFDVLQRMASAKDASEVTRLYTQFLTDSAKQHAEQLREIGELLSKTGKEVWQPITAMLGKTPSRSG